MAQVSAQGSGRLKLVPLTVAHRDSTFPVLETEAGLHGVEPTASRLSDMLQPHLPELDMGTESGKVVFVVNVALRGTSQLKAMLLDLQLLGSTTDGRQAGVSR